MPLVAIAWLYVVSVVAVVEATSTQGTWLGALATWVFYGVLPLAIVGYLFFTPARRRRRKAREALLSDARPRVDPDQGGLATGEAIPPIREEP